MSEDVGKVLSDAWKAVKASGVPEGLQEAAFNRAVDLLSGGSHSAGSAGQTAGSEGRRSGGNTSEGEKAQPAKRAARKAASTGASGGEPGVGAVGDAPTEDEFYERLENETKANRELIEDVVKYSATKPTINVTGRQLGTSLTQKQNAIAVILSVARQIGLHESVTSVNVVREECERFRCADRNLSTHIRDVKGLRLTGDSRVKDIQVRDAALDFFKTEISRIAGASNGEDAERETGD